MASSPDLFTSLGIKLADLASGFGGGMVNALFFQRTNPGAAVASVLGGAITANYLAQTASHVASIDTGVAGFVVGMTAMAICQGLLNIVQTWLKRFTTKASDA